MILRLALLLCLASCAAAQPRSRDYCLDLDGESAVGKLENVDGLSRLKGAAVYTFEAWVRPRTQGGGGRGRILDQERSGLNFYLSDEGMLGFRANRETGWLLSDRNAVTYWKWQHVAVTSDGAIVRFFVDGRLITAVPTDPKLAITRRSLWIGNGLGEDGTMRGFDGWLDDVRVSDTCRWTTDFAPPTKGAYDPPDATTVLYLSFDEGPAHDLALDYSTANGEILIINPLRRVRTP